MAIKDADKSRGDTETFSGGTVPLIEFRSSSDNQRLNEETFKNHTILANKCDYHCYYFLKFIRRNYCLIMPFVSIFIYIYDVFSDFYTAVLYFISCNYWYFGLTLTFIFVPHFIIVAHDLNWYVTDHRKGNILPKWKKIVVGILIGLHIAPILRYFYLFQHEIKIRHKRRDLDELDKEDKEHNAKKDYDSSFLKLLESYFESAPQLVIQICILLQIFQTLSPFRACVQVISIVGSLLSLSLSMVFLQQFKQENLRGENFGILEKILRAFNQLLLVTSRIVAMSLLATVCPYRLVGIIAAHWVLMVFLIFQLGISAGTKTSILVQLGEYAELAVILIFSFISIKKGNNIRNGIFYYLVVLCENIIMMVWWSYYCDKEQWYFLPGIIIHCSFFSFGILMNVFLNGYYEVRKWVELVRDQAEKA